MSDRRPGVVLFLTAGDPDLATTERLLRSADEHEVDWVELAVPFPDSPTDGPTIRRSADRALGGGVGMVDVLSLVARVRPTLRHSRIALLTDWSATLREVGMGEGLTAVHHSGADAVLVHGLPPRMRAEHDRVTSALGLAVVTTCYAGVSDERTLRAAANGAPAYIYLVSKYGRTGGTLDTANDAVATTVSRLRAWTTAPIAVGFGVRDSTHLDAIGAAGADAAVIGTACVEAVEEGIGGDVLGSFEAFLSRLGLLRKISSRV
ncbi:tryptophan synthase subunit alpha [Flexivirga meconopsidis]|uniref:tryptophan synthase subunit alpha n=1 Tax=Flexivirga meconopsidis TaxID=2977121 RepID=UPI002240C094